MPIAPYYSAYNNTAQNQNPWTGNSSTTALNDTIFHLLHQLAVADGTFAITPAPGAGKSHWIQCYTGTGGAGAVGNQVSVTGAGVTSARANMAATLSVAVDNSIEYGYHIRSGNTGSPGIAEGVASFIYTDATDPTVNWYMWGDYATTDLLSGASGASRYITYGVTGASTSTEANVQMPWPCTGYFQYARGAYQVEAAKGTVTAALRVNGADSDLSLSAAAGVGTISDTSTIVSVSAGDLINWRFSQVSPYGYFYCAMMCGFIAS